MNRKYLLITTAVMALGIAPAAFAQASKTPMAGSTTTSTTSTTTTTMGMVPPRTTPSMSASAKQQESMRGNRGINTQEAEVTRGLNQNSANGKMPDTTPMPDQRAQAPGKSVASPRSASRSTRQGVN